MIRDAADGQPHLVGIAVDISEQKRLAEHSAAADRRLRDAVETISAAFVLWDEQNRLVLCNSKFQRLHGLADACIAAGTPYAQVMAHSLPVVEESETFRDADGGGRIYEARLADGRWLQINERRTKDGGFVSVGADISDLKRHEQSLLDGERKLMATIADLRRSRQTLELQAQQLAELAERYLEQKAAAEAANRAKSDFLANMSHELRTPLTHIIGFAEMMENQIFGDIGHERYLDYASDIRKSGEYLRGVIGDVLEMSRLEAGQVTLAAREFEVAHALDAAIDDFRTFAEAKQVTLALDAPKGERAYADPNALLKILDTLLKNALKFTPRGGNVTLRARTTGAGCEIDVEDTGCGMSPEAIEQVCRPFEQKSPLMVDGMKGPGLGLSIARSLVELHGGRLRIEFGAGTGRARAHHPARLQPRQRQQDRADYGGVSSAPRRPGVNRLHAGGEGEVLVGHPPRVVRGEFDPDLVVNVLPLGMVVGALAMHADLDHEGQRLREISEAKTFGDSGLVATPVLRQLHVPLPCALCETPASG